MANVIQEPIWLRQARLHLGTKETKGKDSNPAILEFFKLAGHDDIDNEETAWCAAFVGAMLKLSGYPLPPTATNLMARSYLKYGKPLAEPVVGAICITPRGKSSWQGHVGFVVGWSDTHIELLGGNQSNAVSIIKVSRETVLGYRMPVAADERELREAGSTEIALAEKIKSGAVATGLSATAIKTVTEVNVVESVKGWTGDLEVGRAFLEGVGGVFSLVTSNGLIVVVGLSVAAFFLARNIIKHRIKRHADGQPLSILGN